MDPDPRDIRRGDDHPRTRQLTEEIVAVPSAAWPRKSNVVPARAEKAGRTRVLSVIDDPALANLVDLTLRHGKYTRKSVALVSEARSITSSWKPHLLLVSIDAEDGRARQLLDAAGSTEGPAIIALTRRGDLPGKLDALDRGADDYINVPLEPSDLIARTRAVLLRAHQDPGGITSRLRVADLELDVLRRVVAAQGLVLHLTSLEQALLYLFAANADAVLTRGQILDAIWGTDFVSEERFVDRYVRALRAKLQHNSPKARFIETVPGVGYRFMPRQTAGAPKRATRQEPATTRDLVGAANRRRRPSSRRRI